ncbi:hypothetical protein Gotur_019077 [Gossypium turneri]
MSITGMSEQWVAAQIKQKGDSKCISWKIIFPKALGHIDDTISDLFNRLDKKVTPIPTISVETFRSLSACRRAGEGRFIECAQLLLA